MFCPVCKKQNKSVDIFCVNCGSELNNISRDLYDDQVKHTDFANQKNRFNGLALFLALFLPFPNFIIVLGLGGEVNLFSLAISIFQGWGFFILTSSIIPVAVMMYYCFKLVINKASKLERIHHKLFFYLFFFFLYVLIIWMFDRSQVAPVPYSVRQLSNIEFGMSKAEVFNKLDQINSSGRKPLTYNDKNDYFIPITDPAASISAHQVKTSEGSVVKTRDHFFVCGMETLEIEDNRIIFLDETVIRNEYRVVERNKNYSNPFYVVDMIKKYFNTSYNNVYNEVDKTLVINALSDYESTFSECSNGLDEIPCFKFIYSSTSDYIRNSCYVTLKSQTDGLSQSTLVDLLKATLIDNAGNSSSKIKEILNSGLSVRLNYSKELSSNLQFYAEEKGEWSMIEVKKSGFYFNYIDFNDVNFTLIFDKKEDYFDDNFLIYTTFAQGEDSNTSSSLYIDDNVLKSRVAPSFHLVECSPNFPKEKCFIRRESQ